MAVFFERYYIVLLFTWELFSLVENKLIGYSQSITYSMIDCFLEDALGVLFCPFWSTVLPFGARLPIHTLDYWTV